MKKVLLTASFLALNFSAVAEHHGEGKKEQSFTQKKEMTIMHLDKMIEDLKMHKTCLSGAKNPKDMKACRQKRKETVKASREKMKEARKSMKKKMKEMKEMKKKKVQ